MLIKIKLNWLKIKDLNYKRTISGMIEIFGGYRNLLPGVTL